MNNPFVISSSAIGMDNNIVSLVNMDLIRQNEANGIIFRLDNKELKKLFVLDRQILDLVIPDGLVDLYIHTHEIIYKNKILISNSESEQFLSCDGTDYFKKMYAFSESIYLITISDKILIVDTNTQKIKEIGPDLDESDGLEKLFFKGSNLKYAIGWHGLVLEYTNNTWSEIATPTNRILFSISVMEGGELVIVGQGGVLLHGQPDTLKIIKHDWEGYDFWDIFIFLGKVFILSEIGVFELTKDFEVMPVIGRPQKQSIFFTFKYYKNKLWAVGENHILEYDGEVWKDVLSLRS